jgi:uncharacterized spore protein YtfJ
MNVEEILAQARDTMSVKRVYGEPIKKVGMTIIPVASFSGGGGGGGGQDEQGAGGSGVGYGVGAKPLGVYVIKDGNISWQPAMDLNRVIMGGQIVAIVALLVIRSILKMRASRNEPRVTGPRWKWPPWA